MKNIVLLDCSHKNKSTTLSLAKEILGDNEYDLIDIRRLNIGYCTACGHCKSSDDCIIDDDMDMIYDKLFNSDIIVVSSPVYFNNVTSRLKTLIDRMEVFFNRKVVRAEKMKLKEGYLISTSGSMLKQGTRQGIERTVDLFLKSINSKLDEFLLVEGCDFENVELLKVKHSDEIESLKKIISENKGAS